MVIVADLLPLARQIGTRPHEAHIATQDVEYLRQLVDAVLADEASHPRHARIVAAQLLELAPLRRRLGMGSEIVPQDLVRIHVHRTELVAGKGRHVPPPQVLADALGIIEHRSGRIQLDGDGRGDEDRRNAHRDDAPRHEIERPLQAAVRAPLQAVRRLQHQQMIVEAALRLHVRDGDAE